MRAPAFLLLVACGSSGGSRPPPDARLDPLAIIRGAGPAIGRRIEEAAAGHAPQYIGRVWGASCPDAGAFTLARDCTALRHAVVQTFMGTTWVAIGRDRAPHCTPGRQPWFDETQDILAFELPSGPGGRYFDGKPFGTSVELRLADGQFAVVQMNEVIAAVETPVSLAPGAHVRGAIAIDGYGEGRFDAIVCPDQAPVTDAQPDTPPPATPLDGTVFGEPFHGTIARASIVSEEHRTYVLIGLLDPARGDPGCDAGIDDWFVSGLYLSGAGAGAPYPLFGVPQPAVVVHATREQGMQEAPGVVVWDDVPTTPGAIVRARLVAHSPADVPAERRIDVEGAITATVCPRRTR